MAQGYILMIDEFPCVDDNVTVFFTMRYALVSAFKKEEATQND